MVNMLTSGAIIAIAALILWFTGLRSFLLDRPIMIIIGLILLIIFLKKGGS